MLQRQTVSFTRLHSCNATEAGLHKNSVQTKRVCICSILVSRPVFHTPVLDSAVVPTAFVLSSHLLLGLPNGRFRRSLIIFCAFFVSSVLATCPTHRRLLDFKKTLRMLRIYQIGYKPSQFSFCLKDSIKQIMWTDSLTVKF
jgi:hypothetical protein